MNEPIYGQYKCPKCGKTMILTQDNIVKHQMFCKPIKDKENESKQS